MITLWISLFLGVRIVGCGYPESYYKVIKRVFRTLIHIGFGGIMLKVVGG